MGKVTTTNLNARQIGQPNICTGIKTGSFLDSIGLTFDLVVLPGKERLDSMPFSIMFMVVILFRDFLATLPDYKCFSIRFFKALWSNLLSSNLINRLPFLLPADTSNIPAMSLIFSNIWSAKAWLSNPSLIRPGTSLMYISPPFLPGKISHKSESIVILVTTFALPLIEEKNWLCFFSFI